jgi:parallel beta-helix repeat protein
VKTLTLFIVLCLGLTLLFPIRDETIVNASSVTWIVGDNGFDNIQEAINNASPGDTIIVREGIYYESIVVNKSIILVGEDRENTIINGEGVENVISIKASNVNITGFTIKNSSLLTGCGILVERHGNIIIKNNKIIKHKTGIRIISSQGNQIYKNIISSNDFGIQLIYTIESVIHRNIIANNTNGIEIYYSMSNTFYENLIYNNNYGIYIFMYSVNNVFYHNNFIDNLYHVSTEQTTNVWSYKDEGNYWSDYEGHDSDKDGLGDISYNIAENNKDLYPLMGKFYSFPVLSGGETYQVFIITNSTVTHFTFKNVAELRSRLITFNTSSLDSSAAFSRVTIPKKLIESIHVVLVNEEEVPLDSLKITDEKNTTLYLAHPNICSIKIVYLELLDLYYKLHANYLEALSKIKGLNVSYFELLEEYLNLDDNRSMLVTQVTILNGTLSTLWENYSKLQEEFNDMKSSYYDQIPNLKSLMYMLIVTTAIYIITLIYLSKKAHEKSITILQT